MATRILTYLRVSRRLGLILRHGSNDSNHRARSIGAKTGVVMCGLFTGLSSQKPPEKRHVLEEPDASKLSREFLMKSAGIATTEQAVILLTQAALALNDARTQYAESMFAMCVLMEYRVKVLGDPAEEARISDLILEARELLNHTRQKKQTLEIITNNARNMVNAGAEIAYVTGEELVGSTTGDQLNKIELYLGQSEGDCSQAELKLRDTEVKVIELETQLAEKRKEEEEKAAQAAAEKAAAEKAEAENAEAENSDAEKGDTEQGDTKTGDTDKDSEPEFKSAGSRTDSEVWGHTLEEDMEKEEHKYR